MQVKVELPTQKIRWILNVFSIYDYLQMTEYLSIVINGTMVNSYLSSLEEYTLLI
jgi:hypothetical protein